MLYKDDLIYPLNILKSWAGTGVEGSREKGRDTYSQVPIQHLESPECPLICCAQALCLPYSRPSPELEVDTIIRIDEIKFIFYGKTKFKHKNFLCPFGPPPSPLVCIMHLH